jgi:ESS family glutamate:Na+ symporter
MTVVMSFCGLCLLVALGKLLRVKVRLFQRLYLPSSVIAGLLGLVIIQVCGNSLPASWTAGWGRLPGLLINIVFAALFLGVTIPPLSEIWRRSAPQLAYGQIVAWGQYVVGLGLVLLVLNPAFGVPALFGVIVPVGFEGGHGTAGGLGPTFAQLNWAEGLDFALASATAGIISAIVVGMALVNWAVRKGIVRSVSQESLNDPEFLSGMYPVDARPEAGRQTASPSSVDALALHLAIIGVAILIGFVLRYVLVWLELQIPGMADNEIKIMRAFPLFPLCMIGGLIVQLCVSRFAKVSPIDHGLMQRVGGTALDFLVVAAISTIRVEVIAKGWLPFVVIVAGGILWNVFCVMWLARRVLPNCWFERAIAEMGQSMGVTATGLLLLRAVDPESKTEAVSAFGYKQLLHEPFMGGGLWTSSAVILVAAHGGWPIFAISIGVILAWLVVWWLLLRRKAER